MNCRVAAIDLNDAGIALAVRDRLLLESPGYGLPEPGGCLVGEAARARAWIAPRSVHHRFWDDLSTADLLRPVPGTATVADLASHHLATLWSSVRDSADELIVAVPSHYDKHQLGLLLGIAATLDLPVIGLIDRALAASRAPQPGRTLMYLDVHLHRITLTVLAQSERLRVIRVGVLPDIGILALETVWATLVAEQFVAETRFDPLRRGEIEQDLRNRLPSWLRALNQRDEWLVEMQAGDGRTHAVHLERRKVLESAAVAYRRIADFIEGFGEAEPITLQLSSRVQSLPGLREFLLRADQINTVSLLPGAAAFGALGLAEHVRPGPSNALTTSIPWVEKPPVRAPSVPPPSRPDRMV